MDLNRRTLIVLTVTAVAGCKRDGDTTLASTQSPAHSPTTPPPKPETSAPAGAGFDAGPVGEFKENDVYTEHRDDGFFVIRRDKAIFALSSICTHKGCKVRVADDLSFFCKCHKSEFDKDGHVTKGPAKRDLPRIPVATDKRGHLHVALDVVPRPDGVNDGPPA